MLKIENLKVNYGHICVLRDISLEVNQGEIITVIGSNGSGKSTLLKAIAGVVTIKEGELYYKNNSIAGLGTEKIIRQGICLVPEGRQLFGSLTVLENLELGAYWRRKKESKKALKNDLETIYEMFPVLKERINQHAGTLSGGEQQMLAIGRALMARPELLLLDEPSMGLAPIIIKNIFSKIKELKAQGLTILMVEQDVGVALSIADRGYVMQNGKIVMHDTGQNLLNNEEVKAIYFGKRKHAH